jgi:hypothetical protein
VFPDKLGPLGPTGAKLIRDGVACLRAGLRESGVSPLRPLHIAQLDICRGFARPCRSGCDLLQGLRCITLCWCTEQDSCPRDS